MDKSQGCIWIQTSKNGKKYLSIKLFGDYIAFRNERKKDDKSPDFFIFKKGNKKDK